MTPRLCILLVRLFTVAALFAVVLQVQGCQSGEESAPPSEIRISPQGALATFLGEKDTLTATVLDTQGKRMTNADVSWLLRGDTIGVLEPISTNQAVMTVIRTGRAYVIARSLGLTDSVFVQSRHRLSTFSILPDSVVLDAGGTQLYTVQGRDSSGYIVDLSDVEWILHGNPVGTLLEIGSDSAQLVTTDIGIAYIVAEYGELIDSSYTKVLTGSPFSILHDTVSAGYIGTFVGWATDSVEIMFDTDVSAEGRRPLRCDFRVGSQGWAGWYIEEGGLGYDAARDMSRFFVSGHLRFRLRCSIPLEISIRSYGVDPDRSNAKIMLYPPVSLPDTTWIEQQVPLIAFYDKEPRLIPQLMEVYFAIAVVGPALGTVTQGSFWVDDIRWTND